MLNEVNSEYTIEIEGLENYLVGTDGEIYKKACVDAMGRNRRVLKIIPQGDIYLLNGARYFVEELDPYLKEIDKCDSVVLVKKSLILKSND